MNSNEHTRDVDVLVKNFTEAIEEHIRRHQDSIQRARRYPKKEQSIINSARLKLQNNITPNGQSSIFCFLDLSSLDSLQINYWNAPNFYLMPTTFPVCLNRSFSELILEPLLCQITPLVLTYKKQMNLHFDSLKILLLLASGSTVYTVHGLLVKLFCTGGHQQLALNFRDKSPFVFLLSTLYVV